MITEVLTWVCVYSYPSGFASTRKYQSILSTYWRTVPLTQYLVSNYNKHVFKIRQNSTGVSPKGAYRPTTEGLVPLPDPRGRQGRAPPPSVQSLSFPCSFRQKYCQIIGWCTPLRSWCTPPGKSWIRPECYFVQYNDIKFD